LTLAAGTRLGPYEILAPLGAGGMGEVYRARDGKLDRDVALKVLPEAVARDPEALARFEREAKAVAALSHPNILSIFDFGSHDGTTYAVTELLEGETLRAKIDDRPISRKEALDYALQVATGLTAAHEKGIVHRDLKPENLFVTRDGRVKILDFGLARRLEPAAPGSATAAPTVTSHTEPGTVMGTVGYMSPEQVRGLPVDPRSDIFSFGAILYELLSGRRAFQRATASDTMAAIMRDEPPELSESGRSVPVALDHVVKHCLEKDRDRRFQTARDVAFALSEASGTHETAAAPVRRSRALVGAAIALAGVAAAVVLWRTRSPAGAPSAGVRRVAVLPFENLGAPEDDYFADGIADAVRGKLTTLPGVQVIARSSSTPYKKTTKSPAQIARELDVGYLLTATVRWQKGAGAASRVEVSPELVEVPASGAPVSKWQQPFDAALTDVFQVQSDIATKVAVALGGALGAGEEKRLAESPTRNVAAYDAFLKGEEASDRMGTFSPPALRKAMGFYEQAVALDPSFGQAWAYLSRVKAYLYMAGVPAPGLADEARRAAERAVAVSPDRTEGYLALGDFERLIRGQQGQALVQYARGQRLEPDNADLLTAVAVSEQSLGRWDVAVEHLRKAQRLDPRSVGAHVALASALLWVRRYREAQDEAEGGLAIAPANLPLISIKSMILAAQGDLDGARSFLRSVAKDVAPDVLVAHMAAYGDLGWLLDEPQRDLLVSLKPSAFDGDEGNWAYCLAQAFAWSGRQAEVAAYAERARKVFEEHLRAAPGDAQQHALLGLALAYLGKKAEAIREGERAVTLTPLKKDGFHGQYFQHQLVRIYMLVGEPEKALDRLEPLLKVPYWLSPGWLKIDPNFDPLRKNPRFQKLVAGAG
jgi:TolB-like protein/tetratricopeptide (TPR) repeat protein